MTNHKFSFKKIPGWVYTLTIFGFLYLSGLHTEAIGQVQRLLLFSGIMKPDLPEQQVPAKTPVTTISAGA